MRPTECAAVWFQRRRVLVDILTELRGAPVPSVERLTSRSPPIRSIQLIFEQAGWPEVGHIKRRRRGAVCGSDVICPSESLGTAKKPGAKRSLIAAGA